MTSTSNTKFTNSRQAILEEALRINQLMLDDEEIWMDQFSISKNVLIKQNERMQWLLNEKSGNERIRDVAQITESERQKRWECYHWLMDLDTYLGFEQIADTRELKRMVKEAKRKLHSSKGMIEKMMPAIQKLNFMISKLTMSKIDFVFINKGKVLLQSLKSVFEDKNHALLQTKDKTKKLNEELRRTEKQTAQYFKAAKILFRENPEKAELYRPNYEAYRKSTPKAGKQIALAFA